MLDSCGEVNVYYVFIASFEWCIRYWL